MRRETYMGTGEFILPYIERLGSTYLIRFDVTAIEDGYSYMEFELPILGFDIKQVKDAIISYYNGNCDNEILSGLTYEGYMVWLSTENQFNYKSAWDFAFQNQISGNDFVPVTFKLGEDVDPHYIQFTNIEDLRLFINCCLSHIQNTLSKYWGLKEGIDWGKYMT